MTGTIEVPRRFNGPLDSGNGGYVGGLLAGVLGGGAVEVSLRSPVPLDEPLRLEAGADAELQALQGETVVAVARPTPGFAIEAPEPVGIEEAHAAAERYRAPADGIFSRCFVCGRAREDSFGVFAGPVEGRELVATPWTPPAWTAGDGDAVSAEFVWAALDCPTYFAVHLEGELTMSFLVRQTVELRGPVRPGEEHVVLAWPIERDGRKRRAGSAVFSAAGEILAVGDVLLVEARPPEA